ncbi:MAG: LPS assembly protein LptD [Verrucomicrobia bacterium]|nr:LPS assembly protein LptD [Verrucomicrobiota bacterium]
MTQPLLVKESGSRSQGIVDAGPRRCSARFGAARWGALTALLSWLAVSFAGYAQQQPEIIIRSLTDDSFVEFDPDTGLAVATNGVIVTYDNAILTANRASVNQQTTEVVADGRVRIQQGDQVWVGEHLRYNFRTRQMEAEQFRTGKPPVFAAGEELRGDLSNQVYHARNAYVTTDDVARPGEKVRAKSITIVPGESITARHALLYVGNVPVMYLPYYSRKLGLRTSGFNFVPGYRSRYGGFLLGTYSWFPNETFDAALHGDYRQKRGFGGGPDVNLHLDRWGEMTASYYYLRDRDPEENDDGYDIPSDRYRLNFGYNATPFTNLNLKGVARYQSDELVLRDFFESEYRRNPQPNTFAEVTRLWSDFSLDVYAQPRLNDFFETVERLPDVRLTAFRQQLGPTPLYYESETSAGYYRRRFAESTNSFAGTNNFEAARADTFHQLTLPHTFFGWLNVTPRAGGRFTYYSEASGPGGTNNEVTREVFNTGAEVSVKASRLWPTATNSLLALDGLRHIVQPAVNYVYVPAPSHRPPELPQFDYELSSLRLLPIDFPDYNAIDAIDSQNVLRLGLRNRLQTKRRGQLENLLYWDLYTDWRLNPRSDQDTFSDLYSDLVFRPRSWLTLESQLRYDMNDGGWRLAIHNLTLQPSDRWSWAIGHWYLRDDLTGAPTATSEDESLLRNALFFKLNENWAFRAAHYYDVREGRMEEQDYSVYRDLRSWTAGLTFRLRDERDGPDDYTVAFTFSVKAMPRYALGSDAVRPSQLLGY